MLVDNRARAATIADIIATWCIYAIVFTAPFSKSLMEIAIVGAIVFWAIRKMLRRERYLASHGVGLFVIMYVCATLPSFYNAPDIFFCAKALLTKVLKYGLLYFAIIDTITSRSKIDDFCRIALISVFIVLSDGFFQYFYAGQDLLHFPPYRSFQARVPWDASGFFRGYPTASFPFPNDLAAWILLALFPVVFTIFSAGVGRFLRCASVLAGAGLMYLFYLTNVRGAWAGLALSAACTAVLKKKVWPILLLIVIFIVPFVLKNEMAKRTVSLSSMTDRAKMWDAGWDIFKKHPVIGNGINTFFSKYREARKDSDRGLHGSYAHNCYLQMAADIGLVGLGAFLALIGAYFISVLKGMRAAQDTFYRALIFGFSMGVLAFLVHSFFDTNLFSLNLVTLFWCSLAFTQSLVRAAQRETAA